MPFVVLAGLALVGLLTLVVGIVLIWKVRLLEAFIAIIGGICLAGLSLFLIQSPDDSIALRAALQQAQKTTVEQSTTISARDAELDALRRNLRTTTTKLNDANKQQALFDEQLKGLTDRAIAATPGKGSVVAAYDEQTASTSDRFKATAQQIDELARIVRQESGDKNAIADLRIRLKREQRLLMESKSTIASLRQDRDTAEQVSREQQKTINSQSDDISQLKRALSITKNNARVERAEALSRQRQLLDRQVSQLRQRAIEATPSKRSVIWQYNDSIASSEERYAATEQQIEELGRLIREKPKQERQSKRDFGKVLKLRDSLAYGVETENYDVQVYPDNQLVGGRKGKYYVVDIKDAASGIKFKFDAGRYSLARSSRSFRESLGTFMREVVTKLEGSVAYNLYVRGSADAASYRGLPEKGYEFTGVTYLKAVDQGRYSSQSNRRDIGRTIRNEDLPFLRAEFLRSIVADVYPVKPPKVLEGKVTRGVDAADRNAELIMFVEW